MIERRLAEIHIQRARTNALRLFAFTNSVYPGEWANTYIEEIVPHLFQFAFHARRVNEICDIKEVKFPSISTLLVRIGSGDPGFWEENYHYALNRLTHTKSFVFGNAHSDHRVLFSSAVSNLIPLYVVVDTDQREKASISIFGLVNCFLSNVIPEIRERYPHFVF